MFKTTIFTFSSRDEKRRPSIIRGTCAFGSKIRGFSGISEFVSAYEEKNKNFFRKIEIFHFLPSFFADYSQFLRIIPIFWKFPLTDLS